MIDSDSPAGGTRLDVSSVTHDPDGPPRVALELFRSRYPRCAGGVYQPLRLPDRAALALGGPLERSLSSAVVHLSAELEEGEYALPLGDGPPCRLRIRPHTTLHARVKIGSAHTPGRPRVEAVDLQFSPALSIDNVLQTLQQLHALVDDRRLAPLRKLLGRRLVPRLPPWLRNLSPLGEAALEAGLQAMGAADTAAEIRLERASARPRGSADAPTLPFRFSGRILWMEQVETRFDDFALPAAVLPVPHAGLDRLLSDEPLATAELLPGRTDLEGVLQTLRDTLVRGELDLSAELLPPPVTVRSTTLDGTEVNATVSAPNALTLKTRATVNREGETLYFASEGLTLRPRDAAPDAPPTELELRGNLQADLRSARPWRQRLTLELAARAAPGTPLPELFVDLGLDERLGRDHNRVALALLDGRLSGALRLAWRDGALTLRPDEDPALSCRLRSRGPMALRDARGTLGVELEAQLNARLGEVGGGRWHLFAGAEAVLGAELNATISTLPELNIVEGTIHGLAGGRCEAALEGLLDPDEGGTFDLSLGNTHAALDLSRFELTLEGRRLTLPGGTTFRAEVHEGGLSSRGLHPLALGLRWDLGQGRCLLHHAGQAYSLLTPDLRHGEVVLHLDHAGRMRFSGDASGLYGARYFNALLNPMNDPEQLFDLLKSDDAINRVLAALGAFNPDLAEALQDLRALALATHEILRREGIEQPRHVVPRRAMARLFSLLLCGDASQIEQIAPLIQGVTEARGLDLVATKALLQRHLGEFNIDFEVGALLHWLNLVLSPTEPLERPKVQQMLPLAEDPALADARQGLPSAAEIYAALDAPDASPRWGERLAELAPELTLEQLRYISARMPEPWPEEVCARLHHVLGTKERVERIAAGYGGPEYLLQPAVVATFLGEAVGPLPGVNTPRLAEASAWPPPCALGPREVAVLLQAGLSAGREDKRAQLNNRLLLELIRWRPAGFTWSVMAELAEQNPRALAGILYAFLDQDQDQLAEPIDLVALLEEKLNLSVPRKADYMAGGARARESYVGALSLLAERIDVGTLPCLARKHHLQVHRTPAPLARNSHQPSAAAADSTASSRPSPSGRPRRTASATAAASGARSANLQHSPPPRDNVGEKSGLATLLLPPDARAQQLHAEEAIARADELGGRCTFQNDRRGGPRAKARQAYQRAFRACARLLELEPRAFSLPWLKAFWRRNEAALSVLSVVRGHQQDRDHDRRWLRLHAGRHPEGEQDLLELAVQTNYWQAADRAALLADPLVRLLIDPDPGRYELTIVGCHGVITEGDEGHELEDAYRRLEQTRGVRVVRASTATARSLEYNAARIIEAIAACQTPYGLLGYSQGCANALVAEATLLGGTPDQRALLDGLVCRQLLFTATNGSAHGSAGALKFHRAMVLGEKYLKYYQAVLSREAIDVALRVVRALLDSHLFVAVLGGVHSLTYERAMDLFRDGQFLADVPTSRVAGVIEEEGVPETLEFMFHMLRAQAGPGEQDTQVMLADATGTASRVVNDYTRVLEACDMGCYPLHTHHWAPLTTEVEFVTTERDLARGTYEGPKDRLVWPWVEVNARFGRIPRR